MEALSKRLFLQLPPPSEQDQRSEERRILEALPADLGEVRMSLRAMRQLYPTCQESQWRVTVSLSWNGSGWVVAGIMPGDTANQNYGICTDLGSTTVCMRLVDLETGAVVCQSSAYNRQITYGEDILSRVFYCKDSPQRREELRLATVASLQEVLHSLMEKSGFDISTCGAMTVAGNTAMMHFLLGLDAFSLFAAPYAPRATQFGSFPARELDIPMDGYVTFYPCRANYLGGDIISGIVSTELHHQKGICVFLDIGTNGELVVGNREFLLAGAGAAGPALEGGVVKTGMRALPGAVSYLKLHEGRFHLTVLGGGEPKGLCGSGIVDMIAQLFLHGIIDLRGKFVPEAQGIVEKEGELGICYGPGLTFWQSDIDAFLQTKAAANTMVEYMLDALGVEMQQVEKFYVSGAFGTYLDKESAVTIGLYPDIPRDRIVSAGNTSLEGAQKLLCNREVLGELEKILTEMEYVQFGEVANFIDRMTAAKAIPHTDLSRYPTVRAELLRRGLLWA